MMKWINCLVMMLAAAVMPAGCGNTEEFVVRGRIEGVDVQMVTLTYLDRGGLQSLTTQSVGGKFSFRGSAPKPTLAVLGLGDGQRIATLVVRNGDEVSVEVNPQEPYRVKVSGNAASGEIAGWLNANASALEGGDARAVNAAVAQYVSEHTNRMSATAILVNYYNCEGYEAQADSLFSLLSAEARPSEVVQGFNSVVNAQIAAMDMAPVMYMSMYELRDSLITFTPGRASASLLCFTTDDKASLDTIRPTLRRLRMAQPKERLQMLEISTAPDSATWRRSFRADTVGEWYRVWLPGAMGAPSVRKLAIPWIPYFIVTDSTGAQRYRGASLRAAQDTIRSVTDK